jgi:hypothetical protein
MNTNNYRYLFSYSIWCRIRITGGKKAQDPDPDSQQCVRADRAQKDNILVPVLGGESTYLKLKKAENYIERMGRMEKLKVQQV